MKPLGFATHPDMTHTTQAAERRPQRSRRSLHIPAHTPTTGKPQCRLANFVAKYDPRNRPIFEGELVFVSVEGHHPRKAVLNVADFDRLTSDTPDGPRLTRTRWWLDEDNMLRAYSMNETPMQHGVLVAAAILSAEAGDVLEIPGDPFDLRLDGLRRVAH